MSLVSTLHMPFLRPSAPVHFSTNCNKVLFCFLYIYTLVYFGQLCTTLYNLMCVKHCTYHTSFIYRLCRTQGVGLTRGDVHVYRLGRRGSAKVPISLVSQQTSRKLEATQSIVLPATGVETTESRGKQRRPAILGRYVSLKLTNL